MNENEKLDNTVATDDAQPYIDAMANMKKNYEENYVPKAELEKSKEREAKLLNAMAAGKTIETPNAPKKKSIQELRNELYGKDCGKLNSCEYIQKSLELREALIEAGERDPALPVGDRVQTNSEHFERNDRIAAGLKAMLDFAEGDERIFLAQYQRSVVDPTLPIGKKRIK